MCTIPQQHTELMEGHDIMENVLPVAVTQFLEMGSCFSVGSPMVC